MQSRVWLLAFSIWNAAEIRQISSLVQDDGHARHLLAATTAMQSMADSWRSIEMILEGFLLTLVRDQIPVAIQLQQAPCQAPTQWT